MDNRYSVFSTVVDQNGVLYNAMVMPSLHKEWVALPNTHAVQVCNASHKVRHICMEWGPPSRLGVGVPIFFFCKCSPFVFLASFYPFLLSVLWYSTISRGNLTVSGCSII